MKSLILNTAKQYSLARDWVLNKFNHPILVLMYHRVYDQKEAASPYVVSTANFQNQMHYIKQHFEILRFEDDWNSVDKPSCVVTFDDGYFDNYLVARDFLEKEAIPATFFITTQNIGSGDLFWWDELTLNKDYLEQQTGMTANTLFKQLKNSKPKEQHNFFDQYRPFNTSNSVSNEHYRSMTESELSQLAKLKHTTIGVHTINHPKLTIMNRDEMFFELSESKRIIENITGTPATTCSFPYGAYNQTTLEVCKSLGFQKAATTLDQNSYPWSNPLKTPRISVFNDDIAVFRQRIQRCLR